MPRSGFGNGVLKSIYTYSTSFCSVFPDSIETVGYVLAGSHICLPIFMYFLLESETLKATHVHMSACVDLFLIPNIYICMNVHFTWKHTCVWHRKSFLLYNVQNFFLFLFHISYFFIYCCFKAPLCDLFSFSTNSIYIFKMLSCTQAHSEYELYVH